MKRLIIAKIKNGSSITVKIVEENDTHYVGENKDGSKVIIASFPELTRAIEIIDETAPIIQIKKNEAGEVEIFQLESFDEEN